MRHMFDSTQNKAEIKDLHFRDLCHLFVARIVQVGMDSHKANAR